MTPAWVGGTKQPPYSIHAEKAMLGACLAHAGLLKRVRAVVPSGAAFFRTQHGQIYDVLLELEGGSATVDREALASALADRELLDEVGGRSYLVELEQGAATAETAVALARQVAEKADLRRLIDVASDILSEAYAGGVEYAKILARARTRIDELEPRPAARKTAARTKRGSTGATGGSGAKAAGAKPGGSSAKSGGAKSGGRKPAAARKKPPSKRSR